MLELLSLRVKNLASHVDSIYSFKKDLDIIVGINKDTSSIEISEMSIQNIIELINSTTINVPSNGSGKSVVIEGINLALFGDLIRKVSTKEFIRKGEKECEVELICKNEWLNLSIIRIVRKFYLNKSSVIEIYETVKGQEEIKLVTLADELNKRIINTYIGISKEDLINFFIIQRERYVPFLLLSDSKKKEIISKFTGVDKYKYVEENLEEKINALNSDLINIEKEISKELGKIDILNENMSKLPNKEEFELNVKKEIEKYNNEIEICNCKIKEFNKLISSLKEELLLLNNRKILYTKRKDYFLIFKENNKYIEEYNNYCKEINEDKKIFEINKNIISLESKIKNKQNSLKEIDETIENAEDVLKEKKDSLSDINVLINKLKTLKENLIECPNCKYKFDPKQNVSDKDIDENIKKNNSLKLVNEEELKEVKIDIEELKKLKEEAKQEIEDFEIKIKGLKVKKSERQDELDKRKSILQIKIDKIHRIYRNIDLFISNISLEITKKENQIKSKELEINSLESKIEKFEVSKKEELDSSYSKIEENKKSIIKQIDNINLILEKKDEEKKEINNNIQNYKDSKIVFVNFKNYLYNKIIFDVEQIVNYYLQKFSDFVIELKGTKLLADGKTQRDEINVTLKRNGKEFNYFLMSSGERTKIDISFILTFQHILNTSCKEGGGINFIALDEINNSLDGSSTKQIADPLNQLGKSIIFITHIPINLSNYNVTYIVKENDISKIY